MRFGLVHRLMTDALASLGILALVASGQFSRTVSGLVLVGLVLALLVREKWQRAASLRHFDSVSLVALLVVQVVRSLLGASVLDVLVEFAAGLQIIRLATRKGAAHDQQVIVLALLHLIAGTVLGGGLGYGLCFLGVVIVAPGALVLSHLRREVEGNYRQGARDRTGQPVDVPRILRSRRVVGKTFLAVTCLLAVPILAFTAVLFVVFPRVGLSLLLLHKGGGGRVIGFSGRVDLGEVGVLRSDPALALRVEMPPSHLPSPPPPRLRMHLRGAALDTYDGRAWTQSVTTRVPTDVDSMSRVHVERTSVTTALDPVMRIELEPIDPPVLFLPPTAVAYQVKGRGSAFDGTQTTLRGPDGEFRYQPIDERGLKYEVFLSARGEPSFQKLTPTERPRYLTVPVDLPPRIRKLAQDWTAGATPGEGQARAIETKLRTQYGYDLNSPSGKAKQPLDDFLFESKRGHCEYYSTAMAVMLRTLGVPTRNVAGFIGGTYNRFGNYYAVRQGDAHSWVEVYLDGRGWVTFDPTPPADAAPKSDVTGALAFLRDFIEATSQRWDRHVVAYDLQQQIQLFQGVRSRYKTSGARGVGARYAVYALPVVLLGAGYWLWRRYRRVRVAPTAGPQLAPRSASTVLATSLYESLETVMSTANLARPRGLPPLKHAQSIAARAHPLADEILALTKIYLDARFGRAELGRDDKLAFEKRVAGLRQRAAEIVAVTSAPAAKSSEKPASAPR